MSPKIGPSDSMARQQAFFWTNADPGDWHIYAAQGWNRLINQALLESVPLDMKKYVAVICCSRSI